MKVLVTGGAGFIGSHLVRNLVQKNHEVSVIDNISSGSGGNILRLKKLSGKISFYEADIRNYDILKNLCRYKDIIFHLAAQSSVANSIKDPVYDGETNIIGTLNVLKAAKENNVKRVVLFSSAAVYGNVKKFPIKESFNLKPISPYGLSKMYAEEMCRIFSEFYGIESFALRTFNVYGTGSQGVIYEFIKNAKENKPLVIYGSGKQTRDFIFVSDVAEACISIMNLNEQKSKYFVYNLASGKETSINTIVRIIKKNFGKKVKTVKKSARKGDIKRSVASIGKIKKGINFKPNYDAKKGITELIKEK